MAIPGWDRAESPFHAGERAIHARFGSQDRMEKQGRRAIRDYLPHQFRQFFAQLPYVIVGTVDTAGNAWASIMVGNPGFLSTPDEYTLQVAAQPLFGDPLTTHLAAGIDIGFLGIELPTRRRNRLNGKVTTTDANGFQVHVVQSFGNCPQYIQARRSEKREFDSITAKPIHRLEQLGEAEQAIISMADTLFIATVYQAESAGAASGLDVSHRGGNPGFISIDDQFTLTIPDFPGNCHFNTFGNLELNPNAGILFIDFSNSDLLYLTGTAEVLWEGAEILPYAGAERLLRFHLESGYRVEGCLPLHWTEPEFSPFLEPMGAS